MKILAIETSCDETALAIVEGTGGLESPHFEVLGSALLSQIATHAALGGVVPMLAKREHSRNLTPLLKTLLHETNLAPVADTKLSEEILATINTTLAREPELAEAIIAYLPTIERPTVDAIAVTTGPGLEPALWVGINFAKVLGTVWNLPIIPINHMEGHIVSALTAGVLDFPALALLVSGGHTELVLMRDWFEYEVIGQTRDDAVGEAFDKVARMLNLPYPGGPQISKLAEVAREADVTSRFALPRPMLHSGDYDFSFSGIKTAVLYTLQKEPNVDDAIRKEIALDFENAAIEVLVAKTKKAIEEFSPKTLILGGGVSANTHLRREFEKMATHYPDMTLYIPDRQMSTDNAIMIGMAGYLRAAAERRDSDTLEASGNLSL